MGEPRRQVVPRGDACPGVMPAVAQRADSPAPAAGPGPRRCCDALAPSGAAVGPPSFFEGVKKEVAFKAVA